jgi:uncharacterized membrane protein
MPLWLIPLAYTATSLIAGAIFPRVEQAYLAEYEHSMSVSAAMSFFSGVSSGMMALTGIVFAIAFVVVQFSALAYSPRPVVDIAIRALSPAINDPTTAVQALDQIEVGRAAFDHEDKAVALEEDRQDWDFASAPCQNRNCRVRKPGQRNH